MTDRGERGTGYWSADGGYRRDLVALALLGPRARSSRVVLARVLGPRETAGRTPGTWCSGPAAATTPALHSVSDSAPARRIVSIGTSGVVAAVSADAHPDRTGDSGRFRRRHRGLPAASVHPQRVPRARRGGRRLLGVDHERLSRTRAGRRPMVPTVWCWCRTSRVSGRRTSRGPAGALHGLTPATMSPGHLARAGVEGLLCLLADAVDVLRRHGVAVDRLTLVGGGAQSRAVREIAPRVFGLPVAVPPPGEYVAVGAARQAAWTLSGEPEPPRWETAGATLLPRGPDPGNPGALPRGRGRGGPRPWSDSAQRVAAGVEHGTLTVQDTPRHRLEAAGAGVAEDAGDVRVVHPERRGRPALHGRARP